MAIAMYPCRIYMAHINYACVISVTYFQSPTRKMWSAMRTSVLCGAGAPVVVGAVGISVASLFAGSIRLGQKSMPSIPAGVATPANVRNVGTLKNVMGGAIN